MNDDAEANEKQHKLEVPERRHSNGAAGSEAAFKSETVSEHAQLHGPLLAAQMLADATALSAAAQSQGGAASAGSTKVVAAAEPCQAPEKQPVGMGVAHGANGSSSLQQGDPHVRARPPLRKAQQAILDMLAANVRHAIQMEADVDHLLASDHAAATCPTLKAPHAEHAAPLSRNSSKCSLKMGSGNLNTTDPTRNMTVNSNNSDVCTVGSPLLLSMTNGAAAGHEGDILPGTVGNGTTPGLHRYATPMDSDEDDLQRQTHLGATCSMNTQDGGLRPAKVQRGSVDSTHTDKVAVKFATFEHHLSAQREDDGCHFEILPVWEPPKAPSVPGAKRKATALDLARISGDLAFANFSLSEVYDDEEGEIKTKEGGWLNSALRPISPLRGIWDFISLLLAVWDLLFIPLQLLDPPRPAALYIISLCTSVFWTLDMPLSFVTGYFTDDGSIEVRIHRTALKYVKTWFTLDLGLVVVDWMEHASKDDGEAGLLRMGKGSRAFRIIRMIRLLRLFRMREVLCRALERVQSEWFSVFSDIMRIIVIIVGYSHIIACIWWGIGNRRGTGDDTWVVMHGFLEHDFWYRYSTSLHWSLSQFAGGMDEVTPHNTMERWFAIFVFLVAFLLASMFVSSLTSSMTKLHLITSGQARKFSMLRKYLAQNAVSTKLLLRVLRNAQHALQEKQRFLPESSVELMTQISEPLRIELHYELYSPVMTAHPFFCRYMEQCPQVMRKVCHRAMKIISVTTGDIIFEAGETPQEPKMYILLKGLMQYLSIGGRAHTVNEKDWMAEATLWTQWMHLGRAKATVDCQLCTVESKKFQDIVSQFEHPDFNPRLYAKEFVTDLNDCAGELSDLRFDDPLLQGADVKNFKSMTWLANSSKWSARTADSKRKRTLGTKAMSKLTGIGNKKPVLINRGSFDNLGPP
eukprot:TRINITY_DN41327_c0_g1_i1.p1 TRINITY_DN41327_c0_g1~~TRINITY_DN41327_c0_g1_i1.p1  ORF type:complete len:917 (-),score=196.65 TRINITY_DN41327_c0_g1_i1:78-2828(-)